MINAILTLGRTTDASSDSELTFYQHSYSKNFAVEAFAFGTVSLLLTIINIICIIVTGWAILRLKEVTPSKIPQHFSSFWKQDLKVHRDYLNTIKDGKYNLRDEVRQVLGTYKSGEHALEDTFLQTMFEKAHGDEDMLNIREWVAKPVPGAPRIKKHSGLNRECGSFETGDVFDATPNAVSLSHYEYNNHIENVFPTLNRTTSESHGEILRQRLHTQAQIIISSRRVSSLDLNGSHTEI